MQFQRIDFLSQKYYQSLSLRYDVLRKPLKLHFTLDDLIPDKNSFHLVGIDRNNVVACLVLSEITKKELKMRQVAVKELLQGKGIGKKIVAFAEKEAKKFGYTSFILNARKSAVPFYLSMGYQIHGEEFLEVGIPHFKMKKDI
jgi:predicted GNAT family N-acyltransferase